MDVGLSPTSVGEQTPTDAPLDRAQAVAALERQLAATSRAVFPYQHAAIAYRLGLAHAESVGGDSAASLRKALACYDLAASIFDPRYDPVAHARVLNAAGAAHRALGDRERAERLFESATQLLAGRGRDEERGAAFNNLGLVRTELGHAEAALEACDQALTLFDDTTADGRRALAAAWHTRGLAHASQGTDDGLRAALEDYAHGLSTAGPRDAPYHYAAISQAAGVASIGLAERAGEDADRRLRQAAEAFTESLSIFTRSGFPYQHALAKHNLGLALLYRATLPGRSAEPEELRWALACFEESVSVLDPRLYTAEWQQAYTSLERTQRELERRGLDGSRAEHFAALIGGAGAEVRVELLRERLTRLLILPEPHRHASLTELDRAIARLDFEAARTVMVSELSILMELPRPDLHAGLTARVEAHKGLDGAERDVADRAIDQAVGDALVGPQRVYVRDFLYGLGWERP